MLVIGEIAISLVLLVAGGLMLQSLRRVLQQNPGFEPDHVLTFLVSLSPSYPVSKDWPFSNPKGLQLMHEFLDRLQSAPGVTGASASSSLPVAGNRSGDRFVIEGQAVAPGEEESAISRRVDRGLFQRNEDPAVCADARLRHPTRAAAPWVVIVNEAWVKRYLPNGDNPIGKRIRITRSAGRAFSRDCGSRWRCC